MRLIRAPPGSTMIRTHIGPILGPRSRGYRACPSHLRRRSRADFLGVSDAVVNQPGHGALPRGQALQRSGAMHRNPARVSC